jgi:SpoVK/Ycf46/Vps4 family AAA+-type ATPase
MWREILGLEKKAANLAELIVPRRTFADVVLPDETRQQLLEALTQIEKHRLIFQQWGLGERHPTGLGLAFNFAGPPGTGKTICAEAIAYSLGRKLLRVRYSEVESCWVGETGKNIHAVFREARTLDAILFFDEADSVAASRFSSVRSGNEREANQAVNILLKELEEHEGVVIFATNMASNFDPAFERRIRTHILFRIPSVGERERIWQVQIHPQKTPLAPDVDFRELAERYEVAGGDIRNGVLKAAMMAAAEDGADDAKQIHQRHLVAAMEQVLSARKVMSQNAVDPQLSWQDIATATSLRLESLDQDVAACRTELGMLSEAQTSADDHLARLERQVEETGAALEALRADLRSTLEGQGSALQKLESEREAGLEQLTARLEAQERRIASATLLPWRPVVASGVGALLALLCLAAGTLGGHFWWR